MRLLFDSRTFCSSPSIYRFSFDKKYVNFLCICGYANFFKLFITRCIIILQKKSAEKTVFIVCFQMLVTFLKRFLGHFRNSQKIENPGNFLKIRGNPRKYQEFLENPRQS